MKKPVTVEEAAALEFEAFTPQEVAVARLPTDEEWAAAARTHLAFTRIALVFAGKSKTELVKAAQTMNEELLATTMEGLKAAGDFFADMAELSRTGEVRFLSAMAVAAVAEGRGGDA
jgi:formylglycine-generating enzyme required for sulfatase activity